MFYNAVERCLRQVAAISGLTYNEVTHIYINSQMSAKDMKEYVSAGNDLKEIPLRENN